jgi:hypothetical protein
LRTIRHRNIEIAPGGRWHYLVQTFPDFQARLDTRVYRRSFALTADLLAAGAPHLGTNGISTMTPAVPMHTLEAVRARRAR